MVGGGRGGLLPSSRTILKRSRASLQRSPGAWESVGGRVELTPTEIRFLPHALNFNRQPLTIDLDSLASVTPYRQRIYGLRWLPSPGQNAILLSGGDGSFAHVLVVAHRDAWISAIEEARRALETARQGDTPSPGSGP